eukprot:CCRYP_017180-RA/>CCRYP_017180-RA protein AED:0.19 eAED:0.10 QI:0/0/0/1/0/0/2/0/221
MICYGISYSAFKDYFQMGESPARLCLGRLTQGFVECPAILDLYLRAPTESDTQNSFLHKKSTVLMGASVVLVTKNHLSACVIAWKGQFEGKEGYPTIVLEAIADNNFLDIKFIIDGQEFEHLHYLVDGMYPSHSLFLTTINDPKTTLDCFFAPKQECWCKSIERALGVLKKKFLSVAVGTKCLMYHCKDMFYLVTEAIVIHNMMVMRVLVMMNDRAKVFMT